MPIGISSKRPRAASFAFRSRGYQASGVAILRPSASVTTSSSAVKATETGLISPTSNSKVLMPFAFEDIALRSQVADNSADFMGRKSRIDRNREAYRRLDRDGSPQARNHLGKDCPQVAMTGLPWFAPIQ